MLFFGSEDWEISTQTEVAVRERSETNFSDLDLVEPIPTFPNVFFSPKINFLYQAAVPAFKQNVFFDFSSVGLSGPTAESTSEVVVGAEQTNPTEPSHPGIGIPGEHLEAVAEMPGKHVIS